tara:strand:- start:700 stop:990 length:291 start_codon:yes stop_codon:yes gene_type:complete
MEFNLTKQTQALIIYSSFILEFSSFFLILLFIYGCENYATKSIKIDDDLILQPGSKNENGCTQFFLRSKSGKPTTQVIYTANKKGEYSAGQIKNCI